MTGMEHAIEHAAKVIWEAPTADFGGVSERDAHFLARVLAKVGLLAPAPAPEPRADFADAWDEGWEACHAFMGRGIFPPRTNPYREPVDRGEGDGSADQ